MTTVHISEAMERVLAQARAGIAAGDGSKTCSECGGSGFITCVVTREDGYNDYPGSREVRIDPEDILDMWTEKCSICRGRGRMRYTSDGRPVPAGRPVVETGSAGHVDYRTYIQSEAWQARADAAKTRADWRCQVCNRPSSAVPLNAHHRTYERLGHERPEDITVLCRDCHELYESNRRRR